MSTIKNTLSGLLSRLKFSPKQMHLNALGFGTLTAANAGLGFANTQLKDRIAAGNVEARDAMGSKSMAGNVFNFLSDPLVAGGSLAIAGLIAADTLRKKLKTPQRTDPLRDNLDEPEPEQE